MIFLLDWPCVREVILVSCRYLCWSLIPSQKIQFLSFYLNASHFHMGEIQVAKMAVKLLGRWLGE